ncbi:HNH endonuclease signature motif containing protein [Allobranchiibius sp. GilTou73]|uniref:HNH endonuclease signature motif containing protein n=1 Tax=Allobranchiibius sp. GilTou73 TaxID=2904523 RepID=UPI001F3E76E4|nr:HNH endonuclease signature motif containing protein [Allobranchiibius sp. GilTou73]UIJ34729.1 HNH endonuclease [Allobranchiibius sp. GilTou73]
MSSTPGLAAVSDSAGGAVAAALSATDPLDEVGVICGRLNAAHADLIDLVADLVRTESWAIGGIRSPEHWLTCFAGVSPATARDLVRIATRSVELPALSREVHSGRLSLGQAAVVAAHTPTGYDETVVDLAVHATVPQLRRALVKYDFATTTDEADTPPAPPDPFSVAAQPAELSMWFDHDRFHLSYSAPADIGALVQQALAEAKDALFLAAAGTSTPTDDPPGRRVRMADAMAHLATRSLHVGTTDVAGRADKFRIYLHLDTTGQGWLTTRGALPPHLLRKWTCDGLVQPVWETGGTPVNVGRAHRIVPRRTRRLVEDRDRGCAYPGCLAIHHLECHHVVHWADGGPTNIANLISLCPHHHDRHHAGDFTIHPEPGRPGRFRFATRHGHPIEPAAATAPPGTTPPPVQPAPPRYTGPTNEILHLDQVRFRRRSERFRQ